MTILVVDDHPHRLALLRAQLRAHDYEVAEASNGVTLAFAAESESAIDQAALIDALLQALSEAQVKSADRARRTRREIEQPDLTGQDGAAHVTELEEKNAELERRVDERTARLEAALEELEAFSFSVSHDLRAPLRGIAGFAQALQEDHAPRLDAEGQRLLAVIRAEASSMAQLIDDLLAFSRSGRQSIDRSPVDMTELAQGTFQNLVEAMPGPAPTFELRRLPLVRGDRWMLRQVFANLLGNAIKYSRRQTTPLIQVSGWSEAGWNTYAVKDNGVGFDPQDAPKLFGVFQRLHSQQEFEGTGIGLAIVQRIVRRHGGKVRAEGTVGAGASFFFSLPAPEAPPDERGD